MRETLKIRISYRPNNLLSFFPEATHLCIADINEHKEKWDVHPGRIISDSLQKTLDSVKRMYSENYKLRLIGGNVNHEMTFGGTKK